MVNEKYDPASNNSHEQSNDLHQVYLKEHKLMNKLSYHRKCNIECSFISLQNSSSDASSFTPQVFNSSTIIVDHQSPF